MTESELQQWNDPDVFSGEVHFALLSEGLRGPRMRQLMRLARRNAELGRIFETKVAEFRRYLRETRTPTAWNLPVRAWEWLADHAQFTPPREVFGTLLYVVLVLIGIEVFKRQVWQERPSHATDSQLAGGVAFGSDRDARLPSTTSEAELTTKIETWMLAELKIAAESPAWRKALAQQLVAGIEKVGVEELLRKKVEEVLNSPEFQAEMERGLRAVLARQVEASETPSGVAP